MERTNKAASRNRTQLYIEMLEAKIARLTSEVEALKAVNQANQGYIKKISLPEQIVQESSI